MASNNAFGNTSNDETGKFAEAKAAEEKKIEKNLSAGESGAKTTESAKDDSKEKSASDSDNTQMSPVGKRAKTRWENLTDRPSSSDPEYKKFNMYDNALDKIEKIGGSGKPIDDMVIDLMIAMVCLPLDQIKAFCDYKTRKRREGKDGTKAKKDFEKMSAMIAAGIPVDPAYKKKTTAAYVKEMGFEFKDGKISAPDGQVVTEKDEELIDKIQKYHNDSSEENLSELKKEAPYIAEKVDIRSQDMDTEYKKEIEPKITAKAAKELTDMLGIDIGDEKTPEGILKLVGENASNPKTAEQIMARLNSSRNLDAATSVASVITNKNDYETVSENISLLKEARKQGKSQDFPKEALKIMLEQSGFRTDQEDKINFKNVLKSLEFEKRELEDKTIQGSKDAVTIAYAKKMGFEFKDGKTTTATPSKTAAPKPLSAAEMAKRKGNQGY